VRVVAELPRRTIEQFGSKGFTHSRLARGEVQVSLAELDGVIGGHEAGSRQLLIVLRGAVVATGGDGSAELSEGAAVEWEQGEWHETRGTALVLLVEGEFESYI
jgi:mannose-6-phosphate isomerase-like protein (cupin superfamily)